MEDCRNVGRDSTSRLPLVGPNSLGLRHKSRKTCLIGNEDGGGVQNWRTSKCTTPISFWGEIAGAIKVVALVRMPYQGAKRIAWILATYSRLTPPPPPGKDCDHDFSGDVLRVEVARCMCVVQRWFAHSFGFTFCWKMKAQLPMTTKQASVASELETVVYRSPTAAMHQQLQLELAPPSPDKFHNSLAYACFSSFQRLTNAPTPQYGQSACRGRHGHQKRQRPEVCRSACMPQIGLDDWNLSKYSKDL